MQNVIPDQHAFPPELCAKPLSLVGISGLDTRNNATHKSIWDVFGNTKTDVSGLNYKLIDNAYEFPVVKPKRNSYEWYIPKGILKKNWMEKHLNKIPAVMVIFYDLDWNDPQWNEKMIECASRVQSIRVALEGRNTKLSVVLIQNHSVNPGDDDSHQTERVNALCTSCELNPNSLFVLPHGDHLQGYATRLAGAFNDLAQNYYHTEIRNVKSHREHLQKQTHQYLFVRHQFKMGFLSELKQDLHGAHKHYTHAYNNLLEIRIVDTNAMEIRTVAGFINYKLCRLMFSLNLPRDAISQFKAHTERFKTRYGFQELSFEHHAWMALQNQVFGDIFDEAVKLGLPAVQTQHPGLYYQQAVHHATLRKKACEDLCKGSNVYPLPDPLEGIATMDFYGQRPWRPGKMTSDPPDPQVEWNGIKALQFLENQVNHSIIIITLYGLAVAQFKTYRCPRTRRFLVVQMADEYYNSGDYGKALTLFSHMLWDYRSECWWSLLSHILYKALQCAFLTARIDDYVIFTLELLGSKSTLPKSQKLQIFENLNSVFRKQCPEAIVILPEIKKSRVLWKNLLGEAPQTYKLEMNNIVSCLDCKVRFQEEKYQVDGLVIIEILVRNSSDFQITLLGISISLENYVKNTEICVETTTNQDFCFAAGQVKRFIIEYKPNPADINKELEISSVHLYLGHMQNPLFDLQFNGLGNDIKSIPMELVHFRNCESIDFDNIKALLKCSVVPRHSKLAMHFEHAKPALVGEWYKIRINLADSRDYQVNNLIFEISLQDDDVSDTTEFKQMSLDNELEKLPIKVSLGDISPSDQCVTVLYMRAFTTGERNLQVNVSFNLHNDDLIPSSMEEFIHVSVVKPFDFSTKILTTHFEELIKHYVDETFVIMPIINCLSPWPLVIENTELDYHDNVHNEDVSISSQLIGCEVSNGETASEIYMANTSKVSDSPILIGNYTIHWKRANGESTITKIPINGLIVDFIPLDLSVSLPAYGLVRTPLLVEYQLKNKSHHLIQLDVSVEGSEAFMFAGHKQFQTTILPGDRRKLKYNLYPLIAGSVSLPRLVLSVPENSTDGPSLRQEHLNSLLHRSLPTHIYVMPQMKGQPELTNVIKRCEMINLN
ncbi:PREDICTED: trafficking protein particle complex subunit 11 [Nicrophorus vespilloides]|uniref:Trafficking protein particle complex subunit 11 n=1 Tax=Nicrophorus vespilloides TaxID=110193 RepID=A0ABM1MY11_NICVS|nr:PREDICTED: trafficking protein particle complex subunit 11 [Nicrophorus vespilloides]XP_017779461.1 PREDICTED: trafficking protein particle complex subunit 11 [Nicrophorus vespilloides]